MRGLPKEQTLFQLLTMLSDQKGHCNRELAEELRLPKERVSTLSGILEKNGIVYHESRLTTNPNIKRKNPRQEEKPYYIGPEDPHSPQERLNIFRNIYENYLHSVDSELQEKFLASEYVNSLIKEAGLVSLYYIIKSDLHDDSFNKIASRALLSQPAVIEEYKNQIKIVGQNDYLQHGLELVPFPANLGLRTDIIGILQTLHPLQAIEFYRNVISDGYSKLYREIAHEYFINDPMKEFTDYDIYLSPFTSYPRNNPANLLLQRPYARIYDDAYVLDQSDREKLIRRAYVVYSDFAEILFTGCIQDIRLTEMENIDNWQTQTSAMLETMDDDLLGGGEDIDLGQYDVRMDYLQNIKNHIQITVKLAIYHWNIASSRFDVVNYHLTHRKPRKCHVLSNHKGIQLFDLQGDKHIEIGDDNISLLPGPIDPFSSLWPCHAFDELNLEPIRITYEDILEYVNSRLKRDE